MWVLCCLDVSIVRNLSGCCIHRRVPHIKLVCVCVHLCVRNRNEREPVHLGSWMLHPSSGTPRNSVSEREYCVNLCIYMWVMCCLDLAPIVSSQSGCCVHRRVPRVKLVCVCVYMCVYVCVCEWVGGCEREMRESIVWACAFRCWVLCCLDFASIVGYPAKFVYVCVNVRERNDREHCVSLCIRCGSCAVRRLRPLSAASLDFCIYRHVPCVKFACVCLRVVVIPGHLLFGTFIPTSIHSLFYACY